MSNIKYEVHNITDLSLPFIFHSYIIDFKSSFLGNWHNNPEFLYCTSGSGYILCDSKRIDFQKGDMVIVNSKVVHKIFSDTQVTYRCLIIDNSFIEQNSINPYEFYFCEKICDYETGLLMDKITSAYENHPSVFSHLEIRKCVLEFLLHLYKHYSKPQSLDSDLHNQSNRKIRKALDYINSHFCDKISLDDIADYSGFSKYYFTRIFRQMIGCTVFEHINVLRCKKAKTMLLNTNLPLSKICYDCGFDSPSYFAKTFKTYMGILPSKIRQEK